MDSSIPKKALNDLLVQVMRIQKQYAHEQVGARNDRRAEIKKMVNRAASEIGKKNGN
jgi:low affinity Fe/Cu permease